MKKKHYVLNVFLQRSVHDCCFALYTLYHHYINVRQGIFGQAPYPPSWRWLKIAWEVEKYPSAIFNPTPVSWLYYRCACACVCEVVKKFKITISSFCINWHVTLKAEAPSNFEPFWKRRGIFSSAEDLNKDF